jgi:hypothetical protein
MPAQQLASLEKPETVVAEQPASRAEGTQALPAAPVVPVYPRKQARN